MPDQYGIFYWFCRNAGSGGATLPVCNLFISSQARGGDAARDDNYFGGCQLTGISLSGDRYLRNLGSIILAFIAILVTLFLIWKSDRKRAAVGRREMQIFLMVYIIIQICEIITVGGFPLDGNVRMAFSAVHIAAITAGAWILMMNAAVGFQVLDDGTWISIGLVFGSAVALFIGTGYIALDTAFDWTGYWQSTVFPLNRAYALYTLYQLVPLVFIVIYFLLENFLVLRVLNEARPLLYLLAGAILFAIGQIFQYVISQYICKGTNGAINGGLFETLFTMLAVIMVWVFWSSITEDDWPDVEVVPASEANKDYVNRG